VKQPEEKNRNQTESRRRHWALLRQHLHWPVILMLAGVGICLGLVGFHRYWLARGVSLDFWDNVYYTLQLLTINSGDVALPRPWQLDIARFIMPVAAAGAVLKTMALVFQDRLRLFRVGRMRDHVVICGLGRMGLELVRDFSREGDRVVGIERDAAADSIRACHELGVPVLVGDATDITLLRKARVEHAKHVAAVCGNDGINVDIAVLTYRVVCENDPRPHGIVRCTIQVVDLKLSTLLERHRILTHTEDRFVADIFNAYQVGARAALAEHPLDRVRISADEDRAVQLIIVGFGQMGQSLALQAAKIGCFANGKKPRIRVIDRVAGRREKELLAEYPALAEMCDVRFVQGDAEDPEVLERVRKWAEDANCITTAAVCLDDDSRGLSCALSVLSKLGDRSVPLLVRMADTVGLATLLDCEGEHCEWVSHVHAFGMVDLTCTKEALLHEQLDQIASAIHDEYVSGRRDERKPETDPSMRPWDRLDESLRNSNRQAADHIPVKLRAVGCFSTSEELEAEIVTEFSDPDVELLARMEHARWCAERVLGGWTPGPRDHAARTTPYLVPFDDLPENVKDYDRQAVRSIPPLLAAAGQKIYRVT
jgi:hypothetical protein